MRYDFCPVGAIFDLWPEKDLNEVSRDARSLFARGSQALAQENFDYALTLLNQALEMEPGFFHCRKALRDAQFRKAGDGGSGFFKKMLSRAGSSPQEAKARMALGKNPAEAMAIAEQILNGDPNSSAAHRIIVDAGNALDLPRTVVMSYETLAKNSPKDKDAGHRISPTPSPPSAKAFTAAPKKSSWT